MDDIQGQVFADFEVPATSDGSYLGRKKITEATEKHFDMKFEQELAEVNKRLKMGKTKVGLTAVRGGIQLIATLPLKPDDISKHGREKKQYKISLSIPANFDGLKTAEEEAHELGKLIARQTFTWTDKYLGNQSAKVHQLTFNQFCEDFEIRYFKTRKRTIKSQTTLKFIKSYLRTRFTSDEIITANSLRQKVKLAIAPPTREKCIYVASLIAKELNIEVNFKDLKLKSIPKKRNVPDDHQVVKSYYLFDEYLSKVKRPKPKSFKSNELNKLLYGLVAVYGLRPREVFNQSDLDWFVSTENKYHTFKVHESNKTGYREVLPFVPEWIEIFDLKNPKAIEYLKEYTNQELQVSTLCGLVTNLSKNFAKAGISFTPYDLRHACAIRAHLQGMPIKAAADNLGHSVEIHTDTYQRWFSLENRRKAFEQTFKEMNDLERLKDENASLRQKVAELELESSRLRLILSSSNQ